MTDRHRYLFSQRSLMVGALVLFASACFWFVDTQKAEADEWGDWHCVTHVNTYVNGNYLIGRGCDSLWQTSDPDDFIWRVWADTTVPRSYEVYTYVAGLDTCGSAYTMQMSTSNSDYNTTYGTSNAVQGNYIDCGPFGAHHYRVATTHSFRESSGDPLDGRSGYHTD